MTTDTHTDDDASHTITRRSILAVLATGGGAAAIASAQSDGDEDAFLGGSPSGSASESYRYDAWSFAPSTVPPEAQPIGWIRRDNGSDDDVDVAGLPATFTANGTQWSVATDLATAEGNVTSRPAICVADTGCSVLTDDPLPVTWAGGGVTHIAAADLATAKSEHGGARPAVLFGGGSAEAVI